MSYRLFVSHSSHSPQAQQRLSDLAAAIETAATAAGAPVRVLVDAEQIDGADDWRRRIAFMLHAAHGGVVLLDAAALASPWVSTEASFLAMRQAADPERFRVFPVSFLDDDRPAPAPAAGELPDPLAATLARLRGTAWDDILRLTSLQFVPGGTAAQVADHVVASLLRTGTLAHYRTPADRLADQLAAVLDRAAADDLEELAEQLGFRFDYLTALPAPRAAYALVQHMLDGGSLLAARQQLRRLGAAFPGQRRRVILDHLSPLRLEGEAAAVLTQRRATGGFVHTAVRAGDPDFTVSRYISRAHVADEPPGSFGISITDGSFADLQGKLRQEWALRNPARRLTPAQIDDRLKAADRYVWLPGPIHDDTIAELENAYPRIAFIVFTEDDLTKAWLPPRLRAVTPPLSPDQEEEIIRDYEVAVADLQPQGAP